GSLKKAILVADIPEGEGFDFVLGSRHNAERCTWHVSGTGKSRYEFDLDDVSHCDCPSTCDCAFEVAEARIGSRWDKSIDLAFSVCGVEFQWGPEDDPIVELGPGGMRGLNGWCWRPVSYHEAAFADLDEDLTGENQTVGTVRGGNDQSALLTADFVQGEPGEERAYCDLSNVGTISLTADMPQGFAYEFRIADFYGVAREWSGQWKRDQPTQEFRLCHEGEEVPDGVDCGREEDPIRYRGKNVDLGRVRYLGVQKGYETAADDTLITITDVTFESEGSAAKNCVVSASSGGAGPG
ncbi:MAG TPA: hypothetical protein VFU02_18540, partial [Polyangiaceae bacterium]|nr:hypothetical protein [Polyangiaceae bacterium]